MEVGGQHYAPAALALENDPASIVQEAGWTPGLVWTDSDNLLPLSGFDPRTVQPLASLYRLRCSCPRHSKLFQYCIPFNTHTTQNFVSAINEHEEQKR
jgi:hypothetical protein